MVSSLRFNAIYIHVNMPVARIKNEPTPLLEIDLFWKRCRQAQKQKLFLMQSQNSSVVIPVLYIEHNAYFSIVM